MRQKRLLRSPHWLAGLAGPDDALAMAAVAVPAAAAGMATGLAEWKAKDADMAPAPSKVAATAGISENRVMLIVPAFDRIQGAIA